jgi:TetR/AcrR family transcriptional regulator, copper-responsive repressor
MIQKEIKPRRGRPSTFNRQETITRAMNCYWQNGLYGISINELCKRIHISKPTLYREYTNEDGLLKEILEHYQKEVLQPLEQSVQKQTLFSQKMDTLLTLITTPTEGPSGCLFVKMIMTPERLGPNTLALVQQLHQDVVKVYQSWIAKAQQQGEIKQTSTSYFLAQYIHAQCTIIIISMNLGEDPSKLRKQGLLALSAMYS